MNGSFEAKWPIPAGARPRSRMQSLRSQVAGGTCSFINYFLRQRKVKNQTMRNRKSLAIVTPQHAEEEESFTGKTI